MKYFLILAMLLMASMAFAQDPCAQRFVTTECLESYDFNGTDGVDGTNGTNGTNGRNGRNGVDGIDGATGTNGYDGINGVDGMDGIDGADGRDGIDGIDGADGLRGHRGPIGLTGRAAEDFRNYLAATSAAQIYLPQTLSSRLTFGASRIGGTNGLGVGYAYRIPSGKDNAAVTFSLGLSGGKVAGTASFGFEF